MRDLTDRELLELEIERGDWDDMLGGANSMRITFVGYERPSYREQQESRVVLPAPPQPLTKRQKRRQRGR